MERKWILKKEPDEFIIDKINSSLGFGFLESKILVMRGIDNYPEARLFFKPNINDIHDPFLLKDMDKAVSRIQKAIENNEKILIYGDYDVDGTSSVALLYTYLSQVYNKELLDFYIPDRYSEGYGISFNGIDYAKENGFTLVIALDCGIKSIDEIDYAKSKGIDFIICDHHLPSERIPDAVAVLDPKRRDCDYPYKELSGCGVGFKLCQALNTIYKTPEEKLYELTDLLAISIAADIVSLRGENRVFAKLGLKALRKTKRLGLTSLIPKDRLQNFSISNIVFEVAPKINAAGRISHGKEAVKLLISNCVYNAQEIVENIIELNNERREKDSYTTESALKQIQEFDSSDKHCIVVYDPAWHKGAIGIVASRLAETYHKPTIVFTDGQEEGEIVASARSISDFDIHQALENCSDLFSRFGGHQAAAGLSMNEKNLEEFKLRIEEAVKNTITEEQKHPSIEIDTEIKINDLNSNFYRFHKKLEPFGPDNMKPVLVIRNVDNHCCIKQMGKENQHIKFYIKHPETKRNIECIGFKLGHYFKDFKTKTFDLAFTVEENFWKGISNHYLNIQDVKFH